MDEPRTPLGLESRVDVRHAFESTVTVSFDAAIVGSGQNISLQGVFFTTNGSVPVSVRIEGRDQAVRGELVRFDNMGDGRVGIAVRFVEPLTDVLA